MAENQAVWGIDIGQAGLKAVRLKYAEAANQALAVAFDYIPHAKILSQPDAVPKELIKQALDTFLERNDVAGDLISISLPGHSALARFIQLPPVETSKVADVVTYEARQQIPFALEDVIWDFQTLGGGIEESGFMLGAEVGLFAMKKEQVYEALKPFEEAKVEVETVQIAPLGLYNVLCYDQMGVRQDEEFIAPDEYSIMLDMGTDNTTLLVTNGEKIWIRNVPLGGNHFTRALTKEMKLTFAKAEHLKCNATKSPDPRAVFQALRPVFNDYVSEIQRSIGYFASVNREAKITKVIGVGNGFKLAGLQKFLQQNLQYEVERIETFNGVIGDTVLNAPVFQENIMSFVVPYGLALQTLKLTKIHTTLLPPEIAFNRKIRRKKPWAVTACATLLLGLAGSTAGFASRFDSVSEDNWSEQTSAVETFKTEVSGKSGDYEGKLGEFNSLVDKGKVLVSYLDERELWPEMYRAVNEALPRPVGNEKDITDITKKRQITIRSLKTRRVKELGDWFKELPQQRKDSFSKEEAENPPKGPGYVVTIDGEHFYKPADLEQGDIHFVAETLVRNLRKPYHRQRETIGADVPISVLGISHPVITRDPPMEQVRWYPKGPPRQKTSRARTMLGPSPTGAAPGGPQGTADEFKMIDRTRFTLEFAWSPTVPDERKVPEAPAVDGTAAPPTVPPATAPPATVPGVTPGPAPVTPGPAVPGTATPAPATPVPNG
jgi:type IV pilus assembly protein PilM